jgi:peptidoglycan/xylan/chitin deacetylase (PgdA/CDA1 family)
MPFLSKSRGIKNLLRRMLTVVSRFGISANRFERLLKRYHAVTQNLGCVPTFPITAVILKRHPKLIRELSRDGVEFAVHGYIHTDYGVMTLEEQTEHFQKAINVFKMCEVPFTGFRAPFLRTNSETAAALSHLEFAYDSSYAVHWDVLDQAGEANMPRNEYDRLLEFYNSRPAGDCLVLPRSSDGFVEIPVSIPDDEAMVERMSITDGKKISAIWKAILEATYSSGELFTIQLHPERISFCEQALADIIQQAKQLNPKVWVATLKEIAAWWQEKERFVFTIKYQGDVKYQIKADCSDRATILLKNCKAGVPAYNWFDGYQSITARDFILESPVRPAIGVSPDTSPDAVNFLRSDGFIIESGEKPDGYGIYLDNLTHFDEALKKPLLRKIEQSGAPLLRYWRWPDQARSAISLTGDIDSITLGDFILRIFENLRQSRRQEL